MDKSASRSIHKFNENSGLTRSDELASFVLFWCVTFKVPNLPENRRHISVEASDNVTVVALKKKKKVFCARLSFRLLDQRQMEYVKCKGYEQFWSLSLHYMIFISCVIL